MVENAAYISNPGEPTAEAMMKNVAYISNPGEPTAEAMVENAALFVSSSLEPTMIEEERNAVASVIEDVEANVVIVSTPTAVVYKTENA